MKIYPKGIVAEERVDKKGVKQMNGFKIMADACRKVISDTDCKDKKELEKKIRIYDFLATCDEEDKEILFNSSVFNDRVGVCCSLALSNAGVDEKQYNKVMNELNCLFDSIEISDQLCRMVR